MPFGTLAESLDALEDYTGKFFLGTVFDNDDPDGNDRVRATVPGLYDDAESCPWIGPSKHSSFGEGMFYGVYGSPIPGSQILIILQDGDPHYPIYLGSLLLNKRKQEDASKPSDVRREFHSQAWGFVDPTGNKFLVDMNTKKLTFIHSSLVTIIIQDGTMSVTTPQDTNLTVGGNVNAVVAGDVTVTVAGSVNATVGSNLTATVGQDASLVASGSVLVQGATIQLNGG